MSSDEEGAADAYDYGSEYEDEDDIMDHILSGVEKVPDESPYEVISMDKILRDMNAMIHQVNTVVEIPYTTTRIILNHFKWNEQELIQSFHNNGEEMLFTQAKVKNPLIANNIIEPKIYPDDLEETCIICISQVSSSYMKSLDCGHRFCRDCWCGYLTNQIMSEGICLKIICPSDKCECLIDDQTVMDLVNVSKTREKFQFLIADSLVICNKLYSWCPASGCMYAIKVRKVESRPVTCTCGHTFCFCCGEKCHEPVECNILKKWIKKCEDDSETSNWIAANTQECPKCHAPIQKIDGCNHMICPTQSCKWHFCWECLGPWEPHGSTWYICNRSNEEDSRAARIAQKESRADLQRYILYYDRYKHHMQSLKLEKKRNDQMKKLVPYKSYIWEETRERAENILVKCRQTLMYTYVFAYYVMKSNQSDIFEDNQRDLESITETLSEYLERQINCDDFPKVINLYPYCERLRKILVDHVHEGCKKGWWEFRE